MRAEVSKILPFSCVDGPGNRMVIFLQGCNFACQSCHNPHTINSCNHCGDCIEGCPGEALALVDGKISWDAEACTHCDNCLETCPRSANPKTRHYSVEEMLAEIKRRAAFLTGITVTGGEATMQLGFIVELFKAVKQDAELSHLTCMVDSNGTLNEAGWEKLLPWLDGAMIDLKAWHHDTHLWLTGRKNHRVLRSVSLLAEHGKLHEIRLLHIPDQTDYHDPELATFLARLPGHVFIRLNAFHTHGVSGKASSWQSCSEQELTGLAGMLLDHGVSNLILPQVYQ